MFLSLSLMEGPRFLVNLEKVLLVEPLPEGGSLLSLSGGTELSLEVAEPFEEVFNQLVALGEVYHARW